MKLGINIHWRHTVQCLHICTFEYVVPWNLLTQAIQNYYYNFFNQLSHHCWSYCQEMMINTLTASVPTESSQQLLEGLHNQFLQISRLTSGYLTAFDDFPILSLKSWVMGLMNYHHIQRICIYGFQMRHCNYFNDLLTLYVRTLVRTSVLSGHYWVLWYFFVFLQYP